MWGVGLWELYCAWGGRKRGEYMAFGTANWGPWECSMGSSIATGSQCCVGACSAQPSALAAGAAVCLRPCPCPQAAFPFLHLVPLLMVALKWVRPGVGAPVYIPSRWVGLLLISRVFRLGWWHGPAGPPSSVACPALPCLSSWAPRRNMHYHHHPMALSCIIHCMSNPPPPPHPPTPPTVLYCLSLLRYITFKLSFDLRQIPALNELMRAAMRLLLSGDKSEWDRALQARALLLPDASRQLPAVSPVARLPASCSCCCCWSCCCFLRRHSALRQRAGLTPPLLPPSPPSCLQMPHYNSYSMPAMSLHTGAHLIQVPACVVLLSPYRLFGCPSAAFEQVLLNVEQAPTLLPCFHVNPPACPPACPPA